MQETEAWAAAAEACLVRKGEAMLAIDRPSEGGAHKAELLRSALVATAQIILAKTAVKTVACEGGATAAALCDRLGWQQFVIEAEIAPGIVTLRSPPSAPRLIIKPGSYA